MKKFLGILLISLLLAGIVNASDKDAASLFGVKLNSNVDNYKSKPCYETDINNFNNLKNNNLVDLNKLSVIDKRDWKTLIYTESRLPVTSGCITPLINNDDFFNYAVRIYPKTKDIYHISATYKKLFKYSFDDLLNKNYLKLTGPKTEEEKRKLVSVSGTNCNQIANSLARQIYNSHKKKGFRHSSGLAADGSFQTFHEAIMTKGKNKKEVRIKITGVCAEKGKYSIGYIVKKQYDFLKYRPYFVTIAIEDGNYYERYSKEKSKLKDEIGQKGINKDGL